MERRSDADFALHEQLSAVPLHHLVRDGESESGAVALRREERRSEEHTSELQSHHDLVCRLLLEKKKLKVLKLAALREKVERRDCMNRMLSRLLTGILFGVHVFTEHMLLYHLLFPLPLAALYSML